MEKKLGQEAKAVKAKPELLKAVEGRFQVKLTLTEPMLGTVSHSPEVYARYIETKKPKDITESEADTVDEKEKAGWSGFHKDEKGLFVYDYLIKGFLKAAALALKDADSVGLRSLIDRIVFVFPRRISLGVQQPDGILERPLRAQTMQGPRVSVVRSDTVDAGRSITFEIVVLDTNKFQEAKLRRLLDYGFYQGLGQWRNGSYGRFEYSMTNGTGKKK